MEKAQNELRSTTSVSDPGTTFRVKAPLRAQGGGIVPADVLVPQMVYCGRGARLLAVPRSLAARLTMDEPYVVISIDSPGKEVPALAESTLCQGVLRVLFNDIRRPSKGRTLFTREHAQQILDFVEAHIPRARGILVHCTHGVFRSPAVAAALSTILQGEEQFFAAFHNRNPHVYKTLMAEWDDHKRPIRLTPDCLQVQLGERMVTAADAAITSFRRPYAFLSNFSKAPVLFEGVEYPTVEHAYQAAKTLDGDWRARVLALPRPDWVKQMSRRRAFPMRDGWGRLKDEVMLGLIRQKFADPKRAHLLLSTGRRQLIEGNSWGDRYWGMCQDEEGRWLGENRLGQSLMQVRRELAVSDDGF